MNTLLSQDGLKSINNNNKLLPNFQYTFYLLVTHFKISRLLNTALPVIDFFYRKYYFVIIRKWMWVAINQRKICLILDQGLHGFNSYLHETLRENEYLKNLRWVNRNIWSSVIFHVRAMPWLYAAVFLRVYTLRFWVASIFLGTALQGVRIV